MTDKRDYPDEISGGSHHQVGPTLPFYKATLKSPLMISLRLVDLLIQRRLNHLDLTEEQECRSF